MPYHGKSREQLHTLRVEEGEGPAHIILGLQLGLQGRKQGCASVLAQLEGTAGHPTLLPEAHPDPPGSLVGAHPHQMIWSSAEPRACS